MPKYDDFLKIHLPSTQAEVNLCKAVIERNIKIVEDLIFYININETFCDSLRIGKEFSGKNNDYFLTDALPLVALKNKDFCMFEKLLSYGYDPKVSGIGTESALHYITNNNDYSYNEFKQVFEYMENSKKITIPQLKDALFVAVSRKKSLDIIKFFDTKLRNLGVEKNILKLSKNLKNFDVFKYYFNKENSEYKEQLLENGTALQDTICAIDFVKFLLENDAEVNVIGKNNKTPLGEAVSHHCLFTDIDDKIINLLLNHNADPNLGETKPFLIAARKGALNICLLLKKYNADVNVTENGKSALDLYKIFLKDAFSSLERKKIYYINNEDVKFTKFKDYFQNELEKNYINARSLYFCEKKFKEFHSQAGGNMKVHIPKELKNEEILNYEEEQLNNILDYEMELFGEHIYISDHLSII